MEISVQIVCLLVMVFIAVLSFPEERRKFPKGRRNFLKGQGNFPKGQENFPEGQENFLKGQEPKGQEKNRRHTVFTIILAASVVLAVTEAFTSFMLYGWGRAQEGGYRGYLCVLIVFLYLMYVSVSMLFDNSVIKLDSWKDYPPLLMLTLAVLLPVVPVQKGTEIYYRGPAVWLQYIGIVYYLGLSFYRMIVSGKRLLQKERRAFFLALSCQAGLVVWMLLRPGTFVFSIGALFLLLAFYVLSERPEISQMGQMERSGQTVKDGLMADEETAADSGMVLLKESWLPVQNGMPGEDRASAGGDKPGGNVLSDRSGKTEGSGLPEKEKQAGNGITGECRSPGENGGQKGSNKTGQGVLTGKKTEAGRTPEESRPVEEGSLPGQDGDMASEPGLPALEGVDWNYALENTGTQEILLLTLADYYHSLEEEAAQIEGYAARIEEEEQLELFRIKVHSLKSTSALVGVMHVSEPAKELETAAREGDRKKIIAMTPKLLEEIKKAKKQLGVLVPQEPEEEAKKPAGDIDMLLAWLEMLKFAMLQMDVDSADKMMANIREYTYEDAVEQKLGILAEHVVNLEAEKAAELIGQLINDISE